MTPPELTKSEQKDLDNQVAADIDDWIEKKYLTEVPRGCTEGLCQPDSDE